MNYVILVLGLVWIVCGIIAYGIDFAYLQRCYPSIAEQDYKKDRIACLVFAFLGPIDLIFIILQKTHGYGLKYK